MYKAVNKTKYIQKYMKSLALQTSAPTVHWEDNTSCISFVESKNITPRVKDCSRPRRDIRSHYLVCSKNSLLILVIGKIRDKEL